MQNAQYSVRKPYCFSKRAIANTSVVLHSTYKGDTPCHVWFDLDNFLTQSKVTIIKIRSLQNAQNSVRKTYCFSKQAIAKTSVVLHSTYTGDTPCQFWFDFDNSMTESKKIILETWY